MTRARAGMTLIELTVAIVITGLIVSAGYAAFTSVIDQRERAVRVAAETAHVSGLRHTILRWLDSAIPIIMTDSASAASDVMSQLRVITWAPVPKGGIPTSVQLIVNDGRDGYNAGLVAVFRSSSDPNDSTYVMLDPAARSMRVEFLASDNGVRRWFTQQDISQRLSTGAPLRPVAVRVFVSSTDPVAALAFATPIEAPLSTL